MLSAAWNTPMYNILYTLQHGFNARRSCETQLINLVNDIVNNMQTGLQTNVCVLDFAKAFDEVIAIHTLCINFAGMLSMARYQLRRI